MTEKQRAIDIPPSIHDRLRHNYTEMHHLWNTFHPYSERDLESRFAGAMFETIAYGMMNSRAEKMGLELLSPQETLGIVQQFYPDHEMYPNPFGQMAMEGIWMPDGILLDPHGEHTILKGFCEYTLTNGRGKIGEVYKRFNDMKYPEVDGMSPYIGLNAELHFFVPPNLHFPEDILEDPLVTVVYAPFTTGEFGKYIHRLVDRLGPRWSPED